MNYLYIISEDLMTLLIILFWMLSAVFSTWRFIERFIIIIKLSLTRLRKEYHYKYQHHVLLKRLYKQQAIVLLLSIMELMTIAGIFQAGFEFGWEFHLIGDGMVAQFFFFAIFNILLTNYFWRDVKNEI